MSLQSEIVCAAILRTHLTGGVRFLWKPREAAAHHLFSFSAEPRPSNRYNLLDLGWQRSTFPHTQIWQLPVIYLTHPSN